MSINFCSYGLISSISSSVSCFDGHELSNLVHKGQLVKKGFIADYFVKPPISVTLKFICEVDICCILLKTFVGSQKSVKFDVFTETCNGKGKVASTVDIFADYILFHKYGEKKLPFERVLSGQIGIPFDTPFRLKNVCTVIITILKTSNSSVPCLGEVEVWGNPSKRVSPSVVEDVNSKWKSVVKPKVVEQLSDCHQLVIPKQIKETEIVNLSGIIIPEEFIDPITCDIMLCPMVLPSGKTVDKSTLDKFDAAEEEWGRNKSDPFTGVPFSDFRKPVLDSVLKLKIDKFLVSHSEVDVIKKMPRIIGKKPQSSLPGISQSIEAEQASSSKHITNLSSPTLSHNNVRSTKLTSCKTYKRSLDELISDSLEGLPSYLEPKILKNTPKEECCVCKHKNVLYKLPCLHLICRSCLVNASKASNYCNTCGKVFSRSDPSRYHDV